MLVLGIETSCDETAASIVENGTSVLSNIIATSKEAFEHLGGVIPESAARRQVECILPVITQALTDAHITPKHIDAIAVTKGPGLLGSLLVGTTTARILASVWKKPLIGVHHTLGHLSSTFLQTTDMRQQTTDCFPLLALSVSGGHTELWYRESHIKGILLGQTRDDAAGEAFDKGASLLSLTYPGGPSIQKAAEHGNDHAYEFPLPLKAKPTLDFSFSGLKTALKYLLQSEEPLALRDVAASYQHAICRHLVDRIQKALKQYPDIREIHIVGGVSANAHLRTLLTQTIPDVPARFPLSLAYCTDNAAMIAAAGFFMTEKVA
ncbi:tRNA (adenosine(37)-N6)-threonylcarbamoyltransferase complex transferase subunit TsaD [Candidatus Peregrinibacteria bacterium]|nr:tRNA (adenosine(37)-N6)-threonylcarbamoyltransferase complex transferase subunit TsaD [Candidatus Peregrinibacteria bacterium]